MPNYTQHAGMYIGHTTTGKYPVPTSIRLFILDGQTEKLETILHGGARSQLNAIIIDGYAQPEKACPFFDAWHTEQINGENYLEFVIPGDHPDAQYVKEGNLAAYRDPDGDWQLFEIAKPTEIRKDMSLKEIYAEHAFLEMLDDDLIMDRRLTNETAEFALSVALEATRWQAGTVDHLGYGSTTFYRENPIECIQKIIETWGGELRFRVEIEESGITRYVDLLTRRGHKTGKRFESNKDLVSMERNVDMTVCKTALHGFGRGEEVGDGHGRRITFADVEWRKANGDPTDKPLGQTWVGDDGAKSRWGRNNGTRHRFGEFTDEDIEDPAELLQAAWGTLQEQKDPAVNYTMTVALLEELSGHEHEKVRLGDTNNVIDHEFTPSLRGEARVVEFKRNLIEPEKSEVQMGNYMEVFTSEAARLDNLADTVHNKKLTAGNPVKTDWLDGVIDAMKNQVKASGEYRNAQQLDGGFLLENNDTESDAYGALYLGPGWMMIADTKNANGEWDFRTFGTGEGFTADMVIAGTMLADRIRGGELTLGGEQDRAGIFRLVDESNRVIIRGDKHGFQLADGASILNASGIISVFQYISTGEEDGWGQVGHAGFAGSFYKGRISLTVPIPDNFSIEKASITIEAMPVHFYSPGGPEGWRRARDLKLWVSDGDDGFYDFYDDSDTSAIEWRGASDVTSDVLGTSAWTPSLSPSSNPKIQSKSGDIKGYLTPGEETTFEVGTNTLSQSYNDNLGYGRIIVVVEGYVKADDPE